MVGRGAPLSRDETWSADGETPLLDLITRLVPEEGSQDAVPEVRVVAGTLQPGSVLAPHFEIRTLLGQGGMGQVYEAFDLKLGRAVAIKVLSLGGAKSERRRLLFEREALATGRVGHPGIVTIHHAGTCEIGPFLVLELLRGRSLRERLREGALEVSETLDLGRQVASALEAAHGEGVVHRDLKPDNLWLGDDGVVKVLDFGVARLREATGDGPLSATSVVGTPAYMAPEQWDAAREVDERADLWALGVVLFECLTGRFPHAPEDVRSGEPEPVRPLIGRLLEPRPEARPAGAAAFAELVRGLERELAAPGSDAEQPYHYLEPFTAEDAGRFHGRSREIALLRRLLRERAAVVVVGASGAGKSSLLQAGLAPTMRAAGWRVACLRPGQLPLRGLLGVLAELAADGCRVDALDVDGLRSSPGLVGYLLRRSVARDRVRRLLLVDPLEELFTLSDEGDRQAVLAALASCLEGDPGLRVVLAIRADFVDRLAGAEGLSEALAAGVVPLASPGPGALREALVEPARRLGVSFEPGVAEQVVFQLAEEAAPLPLLQFAGARLWEERDPASRRIGQATLRRVGGVEGMLARHADGVLDALALGGKGELARALLSALVTPDRTRRPVSREQLAGLGSAVDVVAVLDALVAGRLVTAVADADGSWYQLAHESLITRWGRLARWVGEDEAWLVTRQRAAEAARHWGERGEDATLLWAGSSLDEGLVWLARQAGRVEPDVARFLRASERERVRQARRRTRRVGAAMLVLTVLAVVAWGAALRFREAEAQATRRAVEAEMERLIASAGARAAEGNASEAVALLRAAMALGEQAEVPDRVAELVGQLDVLVDGAPLALVLPHGVGAVYSVLPLGQGRVASTSADGRARSWDLATGRELAGHPLTGWADLAVSGGRYVTVDETGVLRVQDPDGEVVEVSTDLPEPSGLAARPGGGVLLPTRTGELRAYGADASLEHTWAGPDASWSMSAASSDGRRVAAGSREGEVAVWAPGGEEPELRLKPHDGVVWHVAFSPSDEQLAAASHDGRASVLELATGAVRLLDHHVARVWTVAWSADGERVLTASEDRSAALVDLEHGTVTRFVGHAGQVLGAQFLDDGRVVTASVDRTAAVWAAEGGRVASLVGHGDIVWQAVGLPDGRVASSSEDGTARVWRLPDGATRVGLGASQTQMVVADERQVLAGFTQGLAGVWDLEGRLLARLEGHTDTVWSVALAPGGTRAATASLDGRVGIWSLPDGQLERWLEHGGDVRSVAWSPTSEFVVAVSADGVLRCFEPDGRLRWTREGSELLQLAFTPDGRTVVGTGPVGEVSGWVPANGQQIFGTRVGTAPAYTLEASPDGAWLAAAGADGVVRLWEVASGRLVQSLEGHSGAVQAVAWSDDGRLASASLDGTVRVWGPDGELAAVLAGHEGAAKGVAWLDGGSLATLGDDGTVRTWDPDAGTAVRVVQGVGEPLRQLIAAGGRLVTATLAGEVVVRPVPDAAVDVRERAGTLTNLRVCRGDLSVVAVVPYPAASEVWAPGC